MDISLGRMADMRTSYILVEELSGVGDFPDIWFLCFDFSFGEKCETSTDALFVLYLSNYYSFCFHI